MKVICNKEIIQKLLEEVPALRDDDSRLIANVMAHYIKDNYGSETLKQCSPFLKMYSENKLPNLGTITRTRRKLQEHIPTLRGERYEDRINNEQDEAIDDVRSNGLVIQKELFK